MPFRRRGLGGGKRISEGERVIRGVNSSVVNISPISRKRNGAVINSPQTWLVPPVNHPKMLDFCVGGGYLLNPPYRAWSFCRGASRSGHRVHRDKFHLSVADSIRPCSRNSTGIPARHGKRGSSTSGASEDRKCRNRLGGCAGGRRGITSGHFKLLPAAASGRADLLAKRSNPAGF